MVKTTPLLLATGPAGSQTDFYAALVRSYGLRLAEDGNLDKADAAICDLSDLKNICKLVGNRGVSLVYLEDGDRDYYLKNIGKDYDEAMARDQESGLLGAFDVPDDKLDAVMAEMPHNIYRLHKIGRDGSVIQDSQIGAWYHNIDINVVLMEKYLMDNDYVETQGSKFGMEIDGKTEFLECYETLPFVTQVNEKGEMASVSDMVNIIAAFTHQDPAVIGKTIENGDQLKL